ncbi:MAG: type VI secretion system tip protein VgrG [Gemmatimonadetes bacterium]|nr:type VI secretion system tip protein VgrG [Gemmatimonadota bacterium]
MADAKSAENWFAKVHCGLDADKLLLRGLTGTEGLSRPFRFQAEFISEDTDVDFGQVVGKPMAIELAASESSATRYFHGVVARFAQDDSEGGFAIYRAELVPWIGLLARSSHTRTWPEKETKSILKEVLDLAPNASMDLAAGTWTRPYTVQYGESDLQFVQRLLEEEGIHYLYEHLQNEHKLVTRPPEPASGSPIVKFDLSRQELVGGLDEFRFGKEQEFAPGYYEVAEFDWNDPAESFSAKIDSRLESGTNKSLGLTDHPMEFVKTHGGSSDSAEKLAKIRSLERDCAAITFRGESGNPALAPGQLIEIAGHGAGFDGRYYIVAVSHSLDTGGGPASGRGSDSHYANSFRCIPDSVAYVPPRITPRPRITGPQTAVVTSNEDPEAHGRVQVRLPWAPEISFWARVVQGWAGAGWGIQFHPRPGHEVVVEFLEGDPDQPLITGRVYNGANAGPYSDNMKLGGIKTRSYEGGADEYNELRFDDTPDAEEVYLHAERNLLVEVEADSGKDVGANHSETIAENFTQKVGGDRNESISGNRGLAVEGAKSETVGKGKSVSVKAELNETIGGKMTVDVSKDRSLTVGGALTESITNEASTTIGKTWTHTVKKAGTMTIGEAFSVAVDKGMKVVVKDAHGLEAKEVAVKAEKKITLECGKAKISLSDNGDIVIEGAKISVKGSGDVTVKGQKIGQN